MNTFETSFDDIDHARDVLCHAGEAHCQAISRLVVRVQYCCATWRDRKEALTDELWKIRYKKVWKACWKLAALLLAAEYGLKLLCLKRSTSRSRYISTYLTMVTW